MALEELKGQKTLNELASAFGVHPVQIIHWKRQLIDARVGVFESGKVSRRKCDQQLLVEQLYQEIGRLKVRWTGCETRALLAGRTTGVD